MAAASWCQSLFLILVICANLDASSVRHRKKPIRPAPAAIDQPWRRLPGPRNGNQLRFMSFNIWNSGRWVEDGLQKVAKHILYVNPDIVAVVEIETADVLVNLQRYLGPDWSYVGQNMTKPDISIFTRHTIIAPPPFDTASVRAKVRIDNLDGSSFVVNFWCLHLDWHDYGPYAACNKQVTEEYQIEAGEQWLGGTAPGRIQNAQTIVNMPDYKSDMQNSQQELMIVAGDLNCPSHLDWIESTKDTHCGWAYQWPATKILVNSGLTDTFRELYPDPKAVPAYTWSVVQKSEDGWGGTIPEPEDRIDMMFYKSTKWSPVAAMVYSGSEPLQPEPEQWYNDWPSDHASIVVDFQQKS